MLGAVLVLLSLHWRVLALLSECERRAPYFLDQHQKAALCSNATTTTPAECAREAHKALALSQSTSQLLDLCSGASSLGPAQCILGIPATLSRTMTKGTQVALCKGEASADVAACVAALPGRLTDQEKVQMCKGGNRTAPAECLKAMPQNMPSASSLCQASNSTAPAACVKALASARLLEDKSAVGLTALNLCQTAEAEAPTGPADCYRLSVSLKHKGATIEDRLHLCQGATGEGPVKCFQDIRDFSLTASEKASACTGAADSSMAVCLSAAPKRLTSEQKLQLCRGCCREDPAAPTQCFNKAPQLLSEADRVELCEGSCSKGPAECALAAPYNMGPGGESKVALCKGAPGPDPALCAKALRSRASPDITVELCHGAISTSPALCYDRCPAALKADLRVQLCKGAVSTEAMACISKAVGGAQHSATGDGMCPMQARASQSRLLTLEAAVELCRDAVDALPIECTTTAPASFSEPDLLTLCEARGMPKGEMTGACASAAPGHMSDPIRAQLCRGAASLAPAECASAADTGHHPQAVLQVCSGAETTTPGYCLNALAAVTDEGLAECREAVPEATTLDMIMLAFEGEKLVTGQPVQAQLEVFDQWSRLMTWDYTTIVKASVAQHGSNGATIEGGSFNVTQAGVVEFSHLRFTGAGNLTLQFRIGDAPLASAAARVNVRESARGTLMRQCGEVFGELLCSAADTGRGAGQQLQVEGLVEWGSHAAFSALTCAELYKENGIRLRQSSDRTVWLQYHPGIEALETGVDLPIEEQGPHERLGVAVDASPSAIRKAYYRQSLIWHPDRWISNRMHAGRAQAVFELVSDAYRMLTEAQNVEEVEVVVL